MSDDPPATPWTPAAIAKARQTAGKWQGTPHRDRMAKPAVGIDCLYFLREIIVDAGILPTFQMPYYKPQWGVGRAHNVIETVLQACCHVETVQRNEPWQDGDIAIWSVGRQSNHCGIILDGQLWHVQASSVVGAETPTPTHRAALQAVLRFTAPGFKRRPETLSQDDLKP